MHFGEQICPLSPDEEMFLPDPLAGARRGRVSADSEEMNQRQADREQDNQRARHG